MAKTVSDPIKALAPIKARTTKMQSVVNTLVISDATGLAEAAKVRGAIKDVAKQVKNKKEEITAPLNIALKNVRLLFAPLEAACDEASRNVDLKVIAYNREVEMARQEAEAREAAKVERGSIKVETAARHLEAVPEVQKHVATDKGSITISKIKKFKVVDLALLPVAYLLPNEPEIRRAMHAGTELPGVEYWVEDSVSGR